VALLFITFTTISAKNDRLIAPLVGLATMAAIDLLNIYDCKAYQPHKD